MNGTEMARYRIEGLVREAEAERRARGTRAGRASHGAGMVKKAGHVLMSALMWPIKH
jgi:hypothetical protein